MHVAQKPDDDVEICVRQQYQITTLCFEVVVTSPCCMETRDLHSTTFMRIMNKL